MELHQLNIIKISKKDNIKKLVKVIKVFLKKKKRKSDNMVVKDTKFKRWKTKAGWVLKKYKIKWDKALYYDYKKLFLFRKKLRWAD